MVKNKIIIKNHEISKVKITVLLVALCHTTSNNYHNNSITITRECNTSSNNTILYL